MRDRLVGCLLAFVVLSAGPALGVVVITTPCGVAVPPGETATLLGDVECSVSAPIVGNNGSILLGRGARLDLNGHTVRLMGTGQLSPIYCIGPCTVTGPGRITSEFNGAGVFSQNKGRVIVRDLSIDSLINGVDAHFARVEVTNVDIVVKSMGITAHRLRVENVSVGLTNPDPGPCVDASARGAVKGIGLTLTGCGDFALVAGRSVILTNLVSVGGRIGVAAGGRTVLIDSSVTGTTYPDGGLDILTRRPPRLTNTTCGRSGRWNGNLVGPQEPWGVCIDD